MKNTIREYSAIKRIFGFLLYIRSNFIFTPTLTCQIIVADGCSISDICLWLIEAFHTLFCYLVAKTGFAPPALPTGIQVAQYHLHFYTNPDRHIVIITLYK